MKPSGKHAVVAVAAVIFQGFSLLTCNQAAEAAGPRSSSTVKKGPAAAAATSDTANTANTEAGVNYNNLRYLEFDFPTDKYVAFLHYNLRRFDRSGRPFWALQKVRAQGRVRLPADVPLGVVLQPDSLISMSSIEQLKKCNVTDLTADQLDLDDTHMLYLKDFVHIINCSLQDTLVSDKSMSVFAGFPSLRLLHLPRTNVTGEQFKKLAGLKHLENFKINYLNLKKGCLADLAGLSGSMMLLNVAGTGLTDDDLKPVSRLTKLDNLDVSSNRALDNKAVETISTLKDLMYLQIRGTQINDRALPLFLRMPRLQYFYIASKTFWITPGASLTWKDRADKKAAARLQILDTSAQNGNSIDLFEPVH